MLPWALAILSSFPSPTALTLVTGHTRMFAAIACGSHYPYLQYDYNLVPGVTNCGVAFVLNKIATPSETIMTNS